MNYHSADMYKALLRTSNTPMQHGLDQNRCERVQIDFRIFWMAQSKSEMHKSKLCAQCACEQIPRSAAQRHSTRFTFNWNFKCSQVKLNLKSLPIISVWRKTCAIPPAFWSAPFRSSLIYVSVVGCCPYFASRNVSFSLQVAASFFFVCKL